MMRIDCPICGPRDHDEFIYVGNADVVWPALDAPQEAWCDAVFFHDNPRGMVREIWQHVHGCGAFLLIERDTLTHEIARVTLAHPGEAAALEPAKTPTKTPAKRTTKAAGKTAAGRRKAGGKKGGAAVEPAE
ncbi:MAG: sarcosine oxidase subunit delta [Pseudomonadota bacterium]